MRMMTGDSEVDRLVVVAVTCCCCCLIFLVFTLFDFLVCVVMFLDLIMSNVTSRNAQKILFLKEL